MKANEAPEKIYILDPTGEIDNLWSICQSNDSIEYIRKDAFIEKACEWIKYNNENGGCLFDGWEEDFKKYIEE